jgi:predicted lipid-binding transport protein (Tim44 family)
MRMSKATSRDAPKTQAHERAAARPLLGSPVGRWSVLLGVVGGLMVGLLVGVALAQNIDCQPDWQ